MFSWLNKILKESGSILSYAQLSELTETKNPGSGGLMVLPFANSSERQLMNLPNQLASIHDLNFNRHALAHIVRATLEDIAIAIAVGTNYLCDLGFVPKKNESSAR